MQRPKDVITGVRLLSASVILFAIFFANQLPSFADSWMLIAFLALALYFICMIWKGRHWARSMILGYLILSSLNKLSLLLIFVSDYQPIVCLLLIALTFFIWGVVYLYKKDSNMWFAELAMEDAQKQLASRHISDRLKPEEN